MRIGETKEISSSNNSTLRDVDGFIEKTSQVEAVNMGSYRSRRRALRHLGNNHAQLLSNLKMCIQKTHHIPAGGFLGNPEDVISFLFNSLDMREQFGSVREAFLKIQRKAVERLCLESKISDEESKMLSASLNFYFVENCLEDTELNALRLLMSKYLNHPKLSELMLLLQKEACKEMVELINSDAHSDIGISKRMIVESNLRELKQCGIGFVNGVFNDKESAIEHAVKLAEYAEARISLVHNFSDILEYIAEKVNGRELLPARLIELQWEEFFKTHGPNAKFLQICHSAGSIHVKHALQNSQYRDRIVVLSVAPAAIIKDTECLRAYNIASKKDLVPLMNSTEDLKHLEILEPHEDEKWAILDHGFDSLTYQKFINEVINKFIGVYEKEI